MKKKDPVESLIDTYNSMVAESDEIVDGKMNKKQMEYLLYYIAQNGFTITDKEYSDGYFIFGFGTNTVVRFRITETPGWLYGIWLDRPSEDGRTRKFYWFCQYERFIDKFKPQASTITVTREFDTKMLRKRDKELVADYVGDAVAECVANIQFIRDNPYLAIYRDCTSADLNTEYISLRKAKKVVKREIKRMDKEDRLQAKFNQWCIEKLKGIITMFSKVDRVDIDDLGEGISPRYFVKMYVDKSITAEDADSLTAHIEDLYNEVAEPKIERYKKRGYYLFNEISLYGLPYDLYEIELKELARAEAEDEHRQTETV